MKAYKSMSKEELMSLKKELEAAYEDAKGKGLSADKMLEAMQHDKKSSGGKIRVVLPTRIGHAEVFGNIPSEKIAEALCGRI